MTCPFAFDDAAYVLGALSPNERQRFQEHLPTCAPCTSGVSELAGLPGLLSRLPKGDVDTLLTEERHDDDAPVSLLPALQTKARRERRKSQWRVAAVGGAIAASLVLIFSLFVGNAFETNKSPSQQPAAAASAPVKLTAVNNAPLEASVTLNSRNWGTMVHMKCTYSGSAYQSGTPEYVLIAKDQAGKANQIAAWAAEPNKEIDVPAATRLKRDQLASLEIQNKAGAPLMTVQL